MQEWEKLEQTEIKVGYRTVVLKKFRLANGGVKEFTTLNKVGAKTAATIALTEDNQVVIARQFRPGQERIFDELPGGVVDGDEAPEAAARRELLEETGYATDEDFIFLGTGAADCYTNAVSHFYLAKNCRKVAEQSLDEAEEIQPVLIPIKQLITNARTNQMGDPLAVLLAYEQLQELIDD